MGRKKYPRYREPLPKSFQGKSCFVGELLKPLLGPERVYRITAEGGLIPFAWRRLTRRTVTA
jgi:hypothetical protein